VHHSNESVTGQRHSLVAFTPLNIFHYWQREYKYEDPRLDELKERREEYQRIKEAAEKIIQSLPPKVRKRKRKVRINHKKLVQSFQHN
jgi:hypothetical protein